MYKKKRNHQFSFTDFNQPLGFKMNPDNRWVRKAELIPWDEIEEKYAELFLSKTGMPAKPLRMALGSLLIQKQYDYSDRELVEQLTENPTISISSGCMVISRMLRLYHRFWLDSESVLPRKF